MPHIDFDSEPAYHWLSTMRIAQEKGVAHTLPSRPASNRAEAEMARAVNRRLARRVSPLPVVPDVPAGEKNGPAPDVDAPPACCRCGSTTAELRLWKSIWPMHGRPRIDVWRCRSGCSAA